MGISNLMKLLKQHAPDSIRERSLRNFTGQTLAIDASMSLYQFLVAVRTRDHNQLTNKQAWQRTMHRVVASLPRSVGRQLADRRCPVRTRTPGLTSAEQSSPSHLVCVCVCGCVYGLGRGDVPPDRIPVAHAEADRDGHQAGLCI